MDLAFHESHQKIDQLNSEAYNIRNSSRQRAIELATLALSESQELGYRLGEGRALRTLATCTHRLNREKCFQYVSGATAIFEEYQDFAGLASVKMPLFCMYNDSGDIEEGLSVLLEAYDLALKADDKRLATIALNNLAVMYEHREDYDRAIVYYHKTIELSSEIGNEVNRLSALSGLSYVNVLRGEVVESIKTLEHILPLQLAIGGFQVVDTYTHLAAGHRLRGEHKKVQSYVGEAEEFALFHGLTNYLYPAFLELGESLVDQKRYVAAINALNRAREICEGIDQKAGLVKIYRALSTIYRTTKEFELAFEALEKHVEYREKLISEKSELRLRDLQIKHEVEIAQAEATIARQRSEELSRVNSQLLTTLAQKEELQRDLFHLASTDDLTGALSRRQFINEGLLEMEKFQHMDTEFTVLMLDVDHFKSINDEFGHPKGDEALRRVSRVCKQFLRKADVFGRIGGEEFSIVLPESAVCGAMKLAERLLKGIAAIDTKDLLDGRQITMSIGICQVRGDHRSFFDVLNEADQALYDAKRNGRNQYQVRNESLNTTAA